MVYKVKKETFLRIHDFFQDCSLRLAVTSSWIQNSDDLDQLPFATAAVPYYTIWGDYDAATPLQPNS